MMQFLVDIQSHTFLQYALLAGVLASVPSGIVGSLIVVRRSSYIAGALSHCILGGMGAAHYLKVVYGIEWLTPMAGALAASVLAALIIGWATVHAKERADSVLSIIWALGMALGITFIMKTPGYGQDMMRYLFGSILMVSGRDLVLMGLLDVVIIGLVIAFYNRILAVCFNEEAALVKGIPVGFYTYVILIVTALTTVLLVQVVGIVLVIALLSLPAAAVSAFSKKLWTMMASASVLSLILITGGLALSYGPDLPAGATIIELAGAVYLAAIGFKAFRDRKKS